MVLPRAGVSDWKFACTAPAVEDRVPSRSVELAASTLAPVTLPAAKENCGPLKAAAANASGDVFSTTSWLPMKKERSPFVVSLNVVSGVTVCVPSAFSTLPVFGKKD